MPDRHSRIAAAFAIAFALPMLASATARAQTRPAILDKMDKAAANFKSFSATVNRDDIFTSGVIHDTTQTTGLIYLARSGSKTTMGATSGPKGAPAAQIVNFDGEVLRVFSPRQNQVEIYKAGNNQEKFKSFLALSAGVSGTELENAWTIKDDGLEPVNGAPAEKLELVSKDAGVRNTFPKVTIWIDPVQCVSLKQLFVTPSGEQQITTYSNISVNKPVNTKPFKIPTGGGVKTIVH